MTLVKQNNVTELYYYDKLLKITCQHCNESVRYTDKSGELLYINFLHACMSTLGIYPEDIFTEIFFFQWPNRTKMHHIYKRSLK